LGATGQRPAAMPPERVSLETDGGRFSGTAAEQPGLVARGWGGSLRVRRFATVGVANTLLDYVLFIALTKVLSLPLDLVWIAKAISGTVAMANSFYLNRRWVFQAGGARTGQAVRFVLATVVGVYAIQTTLTQLLATMYPGVGHALFDLLDAVGVVGAFPNVFTEPLAIKTAAFAVATSVSMTFNFCAYRLWVFGTKA
jgi:putative flippase GtrA